MTNIKMLLHVVALALFAGHMTSASQPDGPPLALVYADTPPVTRYQEPLARDPSYNFRSNGPAAAPLAFDLKAGEGQGRKNSRCYQQPAYAAFNISNKSYYYPRNAINLELTERKDVLELIFKEGAKALSPQDEDGSLFNPTIADRQSSVGVGVQTNGPYEGCPAYQLLLRSFDQYGGHCWLVQPRHQAVSYVSCGAPKCEGLTSLGEYSACVEKEKMVGVWAWCETLPLGRRISKVYVPVPVSCKCKVYSC